MRKYYRVDLRLAADALVDERLALLGKTREDIREGLVAA